MERQGNLAVATIPILSSAWSRDHVIESDRALSLKTRFRAHSWPKRGLDEWLNHAERRRLGGKVPANELVSDAPVVDRSRG